MFYKNGKWYSQRAPRIPTAEKRRILKKIHPDWKVWKLKAKQVHYLYQETFLVGKATKEKIFEPIK